MEWGLVLLSKELEVIKSLLERKVLLLDDVTPPHAIPFWN